MFRFRTLVPLICLFAIAFGAPASASSGAPRGALPNTPHQSWQHKVDPWVLFHTEQGAAEFLIVLTEQADLSGAEALGSKAEKGAFVHRALTGLAERTQTSLRKRLDALGVDYQPFWVVNMLWVSADRAVLQEMALRPDVAHIYANPLIAAPEPSVDANAAQAAALDAIEWNIALVNAPALWAAGATGQGVVIGGQDTGYEWSHPALIGAYRGWNGSVANHDYAWHDAIHSSSGPCVGDSPAPCDDHNHGTHTMGTMVGDDGFGNQIGMAPDARWIGCRNMNQGVGTPATYAECYQWFIAPTRIGGADPDPALAPDVINNSWGCPPFEGCTDPNVLLSVVQSVRAAGIVTVHSAGNAGPSCSTIVDPAAIYAESFTVGATNSLDAIAAFSSRGPVAVDGSGRRKPDIVAPGVSIRSSVRGGGYAGGWSGTSMAGPHVAGLVALLISANPALRGDVDAIEEIIRQSALRLTTNEGCGGDTTSTMPNNTFGWGRIDALAAYQRATAQVNLAIAKRLLTADPVRPGEQVRFSIQITNTGGVTLSMLPLQDIFSPSLLAYSALNPASPPPDDVAAAGVLSWDNLAFGAGLAPGASVTITVPLQVLADTTFLLGQPPCNSAGKTCTIARVVGAFADLDGAGPQPPLPVQTAEAFAAVAGAAPTGVTLAAFSLEETGAGVDVTWRTASEVELAAFSLYRRSTVDGAWSTVATLPAQRAGQSTGAEYRVQDADVAAGQQVEYVLESVLLDQTSSRQSLGVATPGVRVHLPLVVR
jgi:serine protease AprX